MSIPLLILLLGVTVTEGDNCVRPIPTDKNVRCDGMGITNIPVSSRWSGISVSTTYGYQTSYLTITLEQITTFPQYIRDLKQVKHWLPLYKIREYTSKSVLR